MSQVLLLCFNVLFTPDTLLWGFTCVNRAEFLSIQYLTYEIRLSTRGEDNGTSSCSKPLGVWDVI